MKFISNMKARVGRYRFGLVAIGTLMLAGIATSYMNCANAVNTMNQGSGSDFPTNDAIVWRPNRLASFSCGRDVIYSNGTQAKYPSFWTWYDPENNADKYQAGVVLSIDAINYIVNKNMGADQIVQLLPDYELTFGIIKSATDATSGWSILYSGDPQQTNIDRTLHFQAADGAYNAMTIAKGYPVPFHDMKVTTTSNFYSAGIVSLGMLFHPRSSDWQTQATFTADIGGSSQTFKAGEALAVTFNGQGIEGAGSTTAGGGQDPVVPYNYLGFDATQRQNFGTFAHTWKCEHFMVMLPGDTSCQCPSGYCGPNPQYFNANSSIMKAGRFGVFNTAPCFVPNQDGSTDSCYPLNGQGQPTFNPATAWQADPNASWWVNRSVGWRDPTGPHWLSVCHRETIPD